MVGEQARHSSVQFLRGPSRLDCSASSTPTNKRIHTNTCTQTQTPANNTTNTWYCDSNVVQQRTANNNERVERTDGRTRRTDGRMAERPHLRARRRLTITIPRSHVSQITNKWHLLKNLELNHLKK